ncbi:hypothetical protein PRIPAC_95801 [Pristionchus pacificus]|uniref:Protein kinase domain-containing protein n=1 Tax=Pristionchus pacificus TaxID=54126 RepID=A0A2A6B2F7_PRIPA|nr:hypothetical protein PRIPAC_95801 [Pristionchus pacificus]|eukprot:PDM60049.1 protein kinase [Pristionchus pacificus]
MSLLTMERAISLSSQSIMDFDETTPLEQGAENPSFIRKYFQGKRKSKYCELDDKNLLKAHIYMKGRDKAIELFTSQNSNIRFTVKKFMKFFNEVSKLKKFPSSPLITKYVTTRILRRHADEIVIDNLLQWIQIVCTMIMEDTEFIKKSVIVQKFLDIDEEGKPQYMQAASYEYLNGKKNIVMAYDLRVLLNESNYSKTFLATTRYRTTCCSIIIYDKAYILRNDEASEKLKNELSLLKKISLPGEELHMCNRLLHSFSTFLYFVIVTPFYPGGSLENICKGGTLSEKQTIFIASTLSRSLTFLNIDMDEPIVLRTLEASNILIDMDGYPILTDFSKAAPSSKEIDERLEWLLRLIYSLKINRCSTKTLSVNVDWFMLGILLVQITKGCDYDHFNALVPFCRRRDVTSVMCHLLRNSLDYDIDEVRFLMDDSNYHSSLDAKRVPSPLLHLLTDIMDEEDTRNYPCARAPQIKEQYNQFPDQELVNGDSFQQSPFIDPSHAKILMLERKYQTRSCRRLKKEKNTSPPAYSLPEYVLLASRSQNS